MGESGITYPGISYQVFPVEAYQTILTGRIGLRSVQYDEAEYTEPGFEMTAWNNAR